ncbi:MAG: sulfatase-like hydrolase/transferase [Verrucomicrobiia bacterium]
MKPINRTQSTWGANIEALAYLYAFNVLLLMVVGRSYLASLPSGTSPTGWAAAVLAYTANFAMLALAPAILSLPVLLVRRRWLTLTIAPLLFGLLNVFIYADSIIYALWHFHFNGMVWNLLTTPGSGDTVTAGKGTVASAATAIGVIFALEFGFAWGALPRLRTRSFAGRFRSKRAFAFSCGAVVLLVFADKAVYDVGDLRDDMEVVRLRSLLPLYQTVTMKRFAHRVLGMDVTPKPRLQMSAGDSLDYPKSPIRFRAGGPRPNVVVVAIEGARFDMLTPDVMPQLARWGENHLVGDENYSSGNTTRYGLFGLIYGLHGSYWQSAWAGHDSPVLIRALKQLGYKFRILSCTDLNFPEFRGTAFVDVLDTVTDKWDCPRVDRDRLMTDEFIKFVGEKRTPFFAFLFYDASHQPYRYPPEHGVFNTGTVSEEINYVTLARQGGDFGLVENRYRNSLHYVDAELGRALHALEERSLLDNTLVFIVGDHGEAFGELGLFGHDSTFDRYQTRTLLVAHVPGEAPRHIQRVTSHEDVPATVLTYMGAENPLADYTQGLPLTTNAPRPSVFISSWGTAAIVSTNTIISFGLEAYNADITILDTNDVPLPNQRAALAAHRSELVAAMEAMRQFKK